MTEKDASYNLMYFAFAIKEGELCEKLGFPGMAALRPWERRNGNALVRAIRQVEHYASSTKKVTPEEAKDVSLGLFIRFKETFDREMAPKLGKHSCTKFGETLRLYETKLVNE
jgi:hypothetical protein